jgi:hypothetical protein
MFGNPEMQNAYLDVQQMQLERVGRGADARLAGSARPPTTAEIEGEMGDSHMGLKTPSRRKHSSRYAPSTSTSAQPHRHNPRDAISRSTSATIVGGLPRGPHHRDLRPGGAPRSMEAPWEYGVSGKWERLFRPTRLLICHGCVPGMSTEGHSTKSWNQAN